MLDPFLRTLRLIRNLKRAYNRNYFDFTRNKIEINGIPRPWFNYPAIQFLDTLDLSAKKIFEWGAGNSTRYFKYRGSVTYSVEHEKSWAQSLSKELDCEIVYLADANDYVNELVNQNQHFDVILIDGELRQLCAKTFLHYIKSHSPSMLIFDNSDWYTPAVLELMSESKWTPIFFNGFAPLITYETQTLFLLNNEFKIDFIGGLQPFGGTLNK